MNDWVRDIDDDSFEREVILGSSARPVVVDFWAEWCGPCRALGPRLEALAAEYQGAFLLAKVDTETARETAERFQIRSIPAVMGFRDGKVAAEFVGAQPDSAIREFLDKLLPTAADGLVKEGEELYIGSNVAEAEAKFRAALSEDAGHPLASLRLVQLLANAERFAEIQPIVAAARDDLALEADFERIEATLRLHASDASDSGELARRVAEAPDDLALRLALGLALAGQDRFEAAFDALLEVVKRDADFDDGKARKTMLDLFEVLGSDHDLTREYRAKLGRALYR